MSIIRGPHNKENPFAQINRKIFVDPDLSWEAKGLLSYFISLPNDWKIQVSHLVKLYPHKGGGEKAILRMLNELIRAGYCERIQTKKEGGFYGSVEYVIHEFKKSLPQLPEGVAVERVPDDAPHTNKIDIQRKNNTHKETKNMCVFSPFGEHVKLTRESYDQLCKEYSAFTVDEMIVEMNDYISSKGIQPYKDYAATIRSWIRKNQKKELTNTSKSSVAENKKYAESVEKEYDSDYYSIDVLSKSVEFKPNGPRGEVHSLNFDENGFKEQIINKLEKLGFKKGK